MARRNRFSKSGPCEKFGLASPSIRRPTGHSKQRIFFEPPYGAHLERFWRQRGYGMENLSSSSSQLPQGGNPPPLIRPCRSFWGNVGSPYHRRGQGSPSLIKGPSKNVLIDAGENDKGGRSPRLLKIPGVQSLDMAIGTMPTPTTSAGWIR